MVGLIWNQGRELLTNSKILVVKIMCGLNLVGGDNK